MNALFFWIAAALLTLQAPTFRSATALVEVDIIARDGGGWFVSNLTAADFEVFEDGAKQEENEAARHAQEATAIVISGLDS